MARIQQQALSQPLKLPSRPRWEERTGSYLGSAKAQRILPDVRKKYTFYDHYEDISSRFAKHEKEIRDRLREVTLPEASYGKHLHKAQAPVTPAELGWNEGDYDLAVSRARYTRDRFTFSTFFSLERSTYCTIHYLLHTFPIRVTAFLSGVASPICLKAPVFLQRNISHLLYDKGDILRGAFNVRSQRNALRIGFGKQFIARRIDQGRQFCPCVPKHFLANS